MSSPESLYMGVYTRPMSVAVPVAFGSFSGGEYWVCERRDLNPDALRHWILSSFDIPAMGGAHYLFAHFSRVFTYQTGR